MANILPVLILMGFLGAAPPLTYAHMLHKDQGMFHDNVADEVFPLLCMTMLCALLFLAPLGCTLGDELYYLMHRS